MKFKAGDRVHVTKFCWENVDFHATLQETNSFLGHPLYRLVNCTNFDYQNYVVRKENSDLYGERDYYTLATDEEDTEEPVIQHINNMYNEVSKEKEQKQKIELKKQYIIEVKKGLYVDYVDSKEAFYFTKDITKACVFKNREYPTKFAEIIDAKILEIKRYVEVWVYGATRKISLIQCRR